ncbi:MAG: DUF2130 domain-containing protein [Steroidobacteraceae bacterium]
MTQSNARFVLDPDTGVTCPHCEREFALSAGFAKKALEGVEFASNDALAKLREEERQGAERRAQGVAAERDSAYQRSLAEVQKLAAQSFAPQIEALQRQLVETRAQALETIANESRQHAARSAAQGAQLQVLQAEQITLRQERQQLQDEKAAMALEVQRQVDAQTAGRDATVRAQEQERAALEKAELQKTIADMRSQLVEAQRKADQGSQQLQGEVLELAIEESLRRAFPLDAIEEVRKGQRGGDVLHRVVTRAGQEAGIILWETKRAKEWSPQWIPKLKENMRACGAVVGIVVTTPGVFPRGVQASTLFCAHEEVWVTQVTTAVGVAEALRTGLMDVHRQRAMAAGKGEKMEALYDYLTSAQFANRMRAVFEMFERMREELETERNVTQQRWARREKHLQTAKTQLLGLGGEIQGLAQQELPMLEMQPDEPE